MYKQTCLMLHLIEALDAKSTKSKTAPTGQQVILLECYGHYGKVFIITVIF